MSVELIKKIQSLVKKDGQRLSDRNLFSQTWMSNVYILDGLLLTSRDQRTAIIQKCLLDRLIPFIKCVTWTPYFQTRNAIICPFWRVCIFKKVLSL